MTLEPSITRRLALALAVSAFVAFAISGLAFYSTIEAELRERAYQTLKGRLALVAHLIEESTSGLGDAALRGALDDAVLGAEGLRIWVRDAQGARVFGGPWLDAPMHERLMRVVDHDGVALDYLSGRASRANGLMDVAVARDARPDQALLARTASRLLVECLIGALAAALVAGWIVRRELRPLERLGRQAEALSLNQAGSRLEEAGLPSELKPLARSFNATVIRMQEAYRQMEAFNANVAHELRTPIANLNGSLQVALSRRRSEEEWRVHAQVGLEDIERLSGIVNDMLFLARTDAGEWSARSDRTELAEEARKVVDYFEAAAEDAQLEVEISGRAVVQADAALIRRALSNLLSNALRHATTGSIVRIEISTEAPRARVTVTNQGSTVAPEQLPRVFDRFFRGESSRSAHNRGSGLGLSIVAAVARMHGGDVFASSRDGQTMIGFRIRQCST